MDFGVLGALTLTIDGENVPVGSMMGRRLLAILACHANVPVPVNRLAETLWEEPPGSAAENLRQYVYRLRKVLGDRLVRDRQGYRLIVHDGELDANRFETLSAQARAALEAGDAGGAERLAGDALALWRGPAFADVLRSGDEISSLVRPEAERLEQARLAATELGVEAGLRLGRHETLIPELAALVAEHPLREPLRGQWMLALYRAGRQAEALEAYRQGRVLLAAELGPEQRPGPELQGLEQAILQNDPALDLSPLARAPATLPPDAPGFTGRSEEIVRLRARISGGAEPVRISVIVGTGGIGKSALAVHVGHQVAGEFPDGRLYVNLQGSTPGGRPLGPVEALARMLHLLGSDESSIPVDQDEAAGRFRSLTEGKRLLIVLDNAADTAQVRPLIPASPSCAVVITSRGMLTGLDGAVHEWLGVLPAQDAIALLAGRIGAARMDAEAAAEVVRHCGGLPLAICIVAARLASRPRWTLRSLADRLARAAERLDELETADRGVRASFAVSYQDLAFDLRRMFRSIALMEGADIGVSVAADVAGVDDEQAEILLDRLSVTLLIENHAPGRYRMHDLIRLYAQERAMAEDTADERAAAVRRGLEGMLATARTATTVVSPRMAWRTRVGPQELGLPGLDLPDRQAVYGWVDAEAGNLTAAVRQAAGTDLAIALAAAVHMPLYFRGRIGELHMTGEAALSQADPGGVANEILGDAKSHNGKLPEAKVHLEEALAASRTAGNPHAEVVRLTRLAFTERLLGELDVSAAHAREARELTRRIGDRIGEGIAMNTLGLTYKRACRLDEAINAHAEAVAIAEAGGNAVGLATALGNLGDAHRVAADPAEAARRFRQALEIDRDTGHEGGYGEAERRWGLGMALHDLGDQEGARECWRRSATILHGLRLIGSAERDEILAGDKPETPEIILRNF